jgi:hypothetical protein
MPRSLRPGEPTTPEETARIREGVLHAHQDYRKEAAMKTRKVAVELSKSEFRALLLRHAEQDAKQHVEGLQMMLGPEDLALIETFREIEKLQKENQRLGDWELKEKP